MGWGKIEITVSFIQVGFFPIYDSGDMSLQRKSLLFWFLNQKKILSFFKAVEMVRVTQRNTMFPGNWSWAIQAGCLASWLTQTVTLLLWASLQSPSVFEILHVFERSSFLPNNLVLLQCLSILVWVYKGERNSAASWVTFIQCWLLKDSCSGDRCLHLLLILFRNIRPVCCHGSLLYQNLSAILVLHPAFLLSHLFSWRLKSLPELH